MPATVPYVPDRFQSAVPFYVAHRLRYPPPLIEEVGARIGLAPPARVLDLGCGPGFLAIAFAPLAGEVIGMDPDAAMLAAARAEAAAAGCEIRFVEGSSYDLSARLGAFHLVTMGRSFHWMDREATLKALDALIDDGGAVALFSDGHEKCRENNWRSVLEEVQKQFVGASASQTLRRDPQWDSHAAVLLRSAFARVERHSVYERRALSVEEIIGRALSMSATAPQALGERLDEFQSVLRERLIAENPSGEFHEVVDYSALVARRGGGRVD